jgi:hypothetical protein
MSQAEVMLEFLERASQGPIEDEAVDAVMAAPGTTLIIGQMNIMRRVTEDQYATILRSLRADEAPVVEPADDSERASRGVVGLTENVWPILRWGVANTGILAERLAELEGLDVYDTARKRALGNLPRPVEFSPEVFVVMGGRAGAAALSGDRIYVDLLMLSFLDGMGRRPYDAETNLLEFFAHEMHHLGFSQIKAERRAALDLDNREELAFGLLSSVVSEGSATYLINGHRDFQRVLAGSGSISRLADQGDELLASCGRVLSALQAGEITDREQYDAATDFLLGSGAHAAGALMLSRIDRGSGLDTIMAVVDDPRRLLIEYNRAVGRIESREGFHSFEPELAASVAALGKE